MTIRMTGIFLVSGLILAMAQDRQPVQVMALPFSEVAFQPAFEAPATVIARNDSTISSESSGVILKVQKDVGEFVKAGTLLAVVDCRLPELDRQKAEGEVAVLTTQLELAEKQLARARDLLQEQNISQEFFDQRANELKVLEARLVVLQAQLAETRLRISKCSIHAPFNGYIAARQAQLGQMVQPGSPLFRIVETDGAEISAKLSVSLIRDLEKDAELNFVWADRSFPLKLERNPPVIDPSSRSLEVRLSFAGEAAPPGASGRLTWKATWLAVPAHLVMKRGDSYGLMVAQQNQAHFIALEGAVEGRPARAALASETAIITEGRLGLEDKDAIVLK